MRTNLEYDLTMNDFDRIQSHTIPFDAVGNRPHLTRESNVARTKRTKKRKEDGTKKGFK